MADDQHVRSIGRTFLKGAAATGIGLAAAAYVKPSFRVLGVPGALAQLSGVPAESTPVDASTSVSTDPPGSTTTYPTLPSAGEGGTSDASVAPAMTDPTNDSHVPEFLAIAVAGGLIGRRAAKTLRDRSDRDGDAAAEVLPHS